MDLEAKLYYDELSPFMKKVIDRLFKLVDLHVGKLDKRKRSRFLYMVGSVKDLKDVLSGINLYVNQKMYLGGKGLDYLAAIINNRNRDKEKTIEAEKRVFGIDPPDEEGKHDTKDKVKENL
jgi:hypothetical protein